MESKWRWNLFDLYGTDTGFQLAARILGIPFLAWVLKESNVKATIRRPTGPGPDGFGVILATLTLTPADRFPYGFSVEAD